MIKHSAAIATIAAAALLTTPAVATAATTSTQSASSQIAYSSAAAPMIHHAGNPAIDIPIPDPAKLGVSLYGFLCILCWFPGS